MKIVMYCLTPVIAAVMLVGFSIGVVQAGPCILPDFNAANFTSPVTNPYFPMQGATGTTYVYEAETKDEFIRNIIFISTDTVPILGVLCTVIYDTAWIYIEETGMWYMDEMTEDWHAWDNFGNFWYFGESTTAFEYDDDWNFIGCNNDGSWKAGVDGAMPGIIVPANPKQGTCYRQEYYEGEAEDMGKVMRLNANVSVMDQDYEDCLAMKEFTPLAPGDIEHKYYAPDVGLVFIEELKEKTVVVELVNILDGQVAGPTGPPVCP